MFVGRKGHVKIGDFNLSKEFGTPKQKLTPSVCTVYYRAPELFFNTNYYTEKTDVWSIGCAFYFVLTGEHLFYTSNSSSVAVLSKIFSVTGVPNVLYVLILGKNLEKLLPLSSCLWISAFLKEITQQVSSANTLSSWSHREMHLIRPMQTPINARSSPASIFYGWTKLSQRKNTRYHVDLQQKIGKTTSDVMIFLHHLKIFIFQFIGWISLHEKCEYILSKKNHATKLYTGYSSYVPSL